MKNNFSKRFISVLLCMVMLFAVACSAPTPPDTSGNGLQSIVTKTIKYYRKADDFENISVAHYEDTPEILLMDTDTICTKLIDRLMNERPLGFTYEETDTTLIIKRPNGAICTIDFIKDTISYNDYDKFNTYGNSNRADLLSYNYADAQGNNYYFKRTDTLYVAGKPVCIDLKKLDIPLDIYKGKKYIPVQTFSDIFLTPLLCNGLLYNSKDLFELVDGELDASLKDEYYSIESTPRSEALVKYATTEFCLVLDLYYGLKEEHLIYGNFETYLKNTGLWEDINSTDAKTANLAMASLMFGYIADKHSGIRMLSPYTGSSKLTSEDKYLTSPSYNNFYDYVDAINKARTEIMTDGVKEYQEVGNTAYVTFDSFTLDGKARSTNQYPENINDINDTLSVIMRAHEQITREGSPIENVVLDLSCNGGGAADAAVYVIAWMLGQCDLHIVNPTTNAYSTARFKVDVNLDGQFDKTDTITDKNLYCLISPSSFSCGNLVPAMLKESGRVTLLGGTSGGGACAVLVGTTADGSYFQISSPNKLATDINGSYYHIDKGVEPHHFFGKFESYFNRDALTQYINNLM